MQPSNHAANHATMQATMQATNQATKQASKQASKQTSNQASKQQASKQASKQASNQATKQPSNQATKQPSNSSHQATKPPSHQAIQAIQATKQPSNQATRVPRNQVTKQPSNQETKQPTNPVSQILSTRAPLHHRHPKQKPPTQGSETVRPKRKKSNMFQMCRISSNRLAGQVSQITALLAVHTEELDSKGAEELMETGSSSMYRSFGSDAEPHEHGQVRRTTRGARKMHQHWEGEMRACDKLSLDIHADSGRKARRGSRPVEVC